MTEKEKPKLQAITGNRAELERIQADKLVRALLVNHDLEEADAITEVLKPKGKLTDVSKKKD